MKYLALGDSYTIGEGVEKKGTFPYLLQEFLSEKGLSIGVDIVAKTGWTVQELFQDYISKNFSRDFDIVTLLIGVNNQYRKHDFQCFVKGFETMLNEAISKSKKGEEHVFVLAIPNYGLTPFGQKTIDVITEEIQQYNDHIQKRCAIYGVNYVDISEVYNQNAAKLLVEDNLHPSTEMYNEWVSCFQEQVLEVLSN